MYFDLDDELKALQSRARRFVEQELIPHEMEVDETETLAPEVREHLKKRALEEGLWPMNVPVELGGLGQANAISKEWFREERLHIAARSVGAAQRLMEEAEAWCAERETFGRKLHEHQGIGWMLADSATEIFAARMPLYRTAWEEDAGVTDPKVLHAKCSMAKLYCAELGHRVADRVVQIFGGRGYCADYAAERLVRDTRVDRIWEGTSEIMRSIIASGVMKRDLDRLLG
jgi:alkylation response protein AidB-like acyl-CoA dehydrogenase